jgi:peroxiredoxin
MGILEWIVVTVLLTSVIGACVLLYHLMVQNGRILLRLEALEQHQRDQNVLSPHEHAFPPGFPAGTVLSDFSLPSLSGETAAFSRWQGRRVLLIFFNPGCPFCGQFLADLAAFMATSPDLPAIPLFISRGDPADNQGLFQRHDIRFTVLLQEDSEVSSLFKIPGTPTGYLVDERGTTASELLVGADPLMAALRTSDQPRIAGRFTRSLPESRVQHKGLNAGAPAPDFTLRSLDGAELSLKDYRGRRVLLVFSDPECQPCDRVAKELERIHRESDGLQVLMVSRGEGDANRQRAAEYGLTFPIGLQRHWEVSRSYAMFATPVGYLIDAKGVLLSDALVGAEPILKFALRNWR